MSPRYPEGIGGQGSGETLNQGVNDFGHANYDGPCPLQAMARIITTDGRLRTYARATMAPEATAK